ncbi:MAG TPA: SusC/RagA family TonB-linked outer membrane protein [Ferruginibacter sp.]|jgi:TonB-linked SusC/RagA family outer membrane protein|nr:SusC/RagA family TonB-linked outer membrane protein [Ferruginibacter sp.]
MKKLLTLLGAFLLLSSHSLFAQGIVSGKITDAKDGTPLSGISVKVKGSAIGTSTGGDGTFSLNVTENNVILEISGIGYLAKEVPASVGSDVAVSITKDVKALTEVVVTALGIKRAERGLGYSVSKVDPNILLQKSEPDVLKALEGKVAGVNIQQSQGTPGAATRITIRGDATFFGDAQPLIIVDGVPFSNDQITTTNQVSGGGAYSSGISDLDPNDIATLNILKGSAASALYGSRAANGVIIITTKSGSASRSRKGLEVTYSTSLAFEKVANLPDYQNQFGQGAYDVAGNGSNGSWGANFKNVDSIATYAAYAGYPGIGDSLPYQAYPNNVKDLFRTGHIYENSLNFSGGNEKTSFNSTVSYINHDGYVPNSNYDRANLSFGGYTKLDNGLNIRANFSYSKSNQLGSLFGEAQSNAPSSFARSLLLARSWNLEGLPSQDASGKPLSPLPTQFDNPFWADYHNTSATGETRTIVGIHLDYAIRKWLHADYQIGSNAMSLTRKEVIDIGSLAASGVGNITEENYTSEQIESNFILTFTPNIGNIFSFKLLGGQNVSQVKTTDLVNIGNDFITAGIYSLHNAASVTNNIDQFTLHRLIGLYADATLGFKNFAFIDLTARNDQSSTLSTSKNSYLYYGASGSLVFTDALKIKSDVLDFGKIRAGWAKVGADAQPYLTQNTFLLNPPILGQSSASNNVQSANADIGPEFTRETELGTQLSFFKRRISLDFTWYDKITDLLISPATTPASSGYIALIENLGKISNKGVEIDLGITPIRTKSFEWDIHGTFTHNENVVLSLTNGLTRLPLFGVLGGTNSINPYIEVGKPVGFLYGSKTVRDSLGNVLIDPQTGDMITSHTLGDIGDPNPKYKMGLDNTFVYKGFTLDILIDYTHGGQIYSESITNELGRGVTKDTQDRETSWIINGVYGDPTTEKPILTSGGQEIANTKRLATEDIYFFGGTGNEGTFATNAASEWNVYDATVWHLREVSLGYEIPKRFLGRLPIGSASLSVTGRNLWFFAPGVPKYTNFDPEQNSFGSTSTQGIELSSAPTTKRYGINLKVTF